MYANQYGRGRIDPASLLIAVTLSAALIGGLVTASPTVTAAIERTLATYQVPLDPVPPLDQPPPQPKAMPQQRAITSIDMPRPLVAPPPTASELVTPPQPVVIDLGRAGSGPIGAVAVDPPRPAPVIVAPGVDPRFAGLLQPPYPSEEQRAGREGRVTVRVLVGVDGRIRAVERVDATTDAFFRAVERQALSRWRFTPGTRDGIPVEAWRTMSLRFVLEE